MYGLDNQSGVNAMPALAPVKSPTPLWFTEGGSGLAPSYPGQDWFNMVQAEMLNVLTVGGVKPEKDKLNQLAEAISKIISDAGFQPSGDYATKDELKTGLDSKLGTDAIVQYGGINEDVTMSQKAITEMAAKKLDKTGGELTGVLFFRELLSNKLAGTNKQVLNSSSASVYLGNPVSVDEVRLQTNSGIARVDEGGKSYRIYHEGYEPGSVPIGASVIWNTSAPIPVNFWANEGRAFSATEYPEAAKAMPDLRVPDDRGYAIRAADNGRGIDSGRTVGTYQQDAMRNLTGSVVSTGLATTSGLVAEGVFARNETFKASDSQPGGTVWAGQGFTLDISRQVPTADEFRMKNVAKILITRMK